MYIYICKFNNMNWKLYLKGFFMIITQVMVSNGGYNLPALLPLVPETSSFFLCPLLSGPYTISFHISWIVNATSITSLTVSCMDTNTCSYIPFARDALPA